MKNELSLPAIRISFRFQFLPFSCFNKRRFTQFKFEISRWPRMSQWIQWTPMYSTWSVFRTSQACNETASEYFEFDGAVGESRKRDANAFLSCNPRTRHRNTRWRLKWTNSVLRIWTAAPYYTTEPERSEPAAHYIQHSGINGGSKLTVRWIWQ